MTARGLPLAAAGLCLVLATTATAAPPLSDTAPWARPYAGRWTLSGGSEGDPVCGVTLSADQAIGGAQLDMSATCRRNYPFEGVAAWSLNGKTIHLIDALRKTLFVFTPGPDRAWSADIPGHGRVFLERGAPERPKSLKALFNDEVTFTLSGPDNFRPCGFAVEARTATQGKLQQAGRCAAPWKGKGWASWSAAGDRLQLKTGKGAVILTLTRADEYTFAAEVAGQPVFFGPGVIDGSEALGK